MAPYSRSYGRTMVATVLEGEDGGVALAGRTLRVGGWVKTGREAGAGAFAFLEVNDGSCFQNIQARASQVLAPGGHQPCRAGGRVGRGSGGRGAAVRPS